jgi:hypothetical protein
MTDVRDESDPVTGDEAEEEPAPPRRIGFRLPRALRDALPALLGYLAVRLLGLSILLLFATRVSPDDTPMPPFPESVEALLNRFDGLWYVGIATGGYDTSIRYDDDGALVNTNIAFFPLLPWLIRAGVALNLPAVPTGLVVVALAGLAAAWGLYAVGAELHSRTVGTVLAVLWGAVPHAVVENMVYTESLFTALAAWALWALLRRRWLLAGALTAVAGLSRPTAIALIGAVGLTCLVAIIRRGAGWRPWVAGAIAPLGLLGFWGWAGWKLGRIDGWLWMQGAAWHNHFDAGRTAVETIVSTLYREHDLAIYATTLVVVIAVALLVVLILDRRWPLPIIAYSAAVVALAVLQGGGYFYAKGRFLLPAFTLLLPVAMALVRASRTTRYTVLTTLAVLSAWYGTYLLLIWGRSP